jgi:GT2 family glycosyltransferase
VDDAVLSVLAQGLTDLELILVDDGSTDATFEKAQAWAARDHRISVVRQRNQGLSAARNAGIQESSGSLLQFLDADDVLLPEKLERQAALLAAEPAASIAFGLAETVNDMGKRVFDCRPPRDGDLGVELLRSNALVVNAALVRRSVFEDVGLFKVQSTCRYPLYGCEDWDLWLRAAMAGHAFVYRPEWVARNRWHEANMSQDELRMKRSALWVLTEARTLADEMNGRQRVTLRTQRFYRWCDYVCRLLDAGNAADARAECRATLCEMPWSLEAIVARGIESGWFRGVPKGATWHVARFAGRIHTIPTRLARGKTGARRWASTAMTKPNACSSPGRGRRLVVGPIALAAHAAASSSWYVRVGEVEPRTLEIVASGFDEVLVSEDAVADSASVPSHARVVQQPSAGTTSGNPRVLFLVSNDTHAEFLQPIAERFEHSAFAVPDPIRHDEGASQKLSLQRPVFILNRRGRSGVLAFRPDLWLCANDWSPDFARLRGWLPGTRAVALQEGPQEWGMRAAGRTIWQYDSADILFAQGPDTLRHIRPRRFAITGNPKLDRIHPLPLPNQPRVLVNCNFTYGRYTKHRSRWLNDILWALEHLDMPYVISKHPRDESQWDHPNLLESNAFRIRDQIAECSMVVSRFSSLLLEGPAFGRQVVYYNPHREPMQRGFAQTTGVLLHATTVLELVTLLRVHRDAPRSASAREMLHDYCGPLDGLAVDRIEYFLRHLATSGQSSSRPRRP